MAWSLKPLGDRVVVKPKGRDETDARAASSCRTRRARSRSRARCCRSARGGVLDNGKRVELDLKVGDTVLFAKYSGTEFKHEDDDLLILSERDILAVIENGK